MKVAIHQPLYLPYPGFFHKVGCADALVIMDDVQRDKGYSSRNRVLTSQGQAWLTIPLRRHQAFVPSRDVKIENSQPWEVSHWKTIRLSYARARYYGLYSEYLKNIYAKPWDLLFDLDIETTKKLFEWLGMKVQMIFESELKIKGTSTERLVNVCKALGADTYVSGIGGRQYLDESAFPKSNIKLEYQPYRSAPYPQRFTETFVPNLSVLDMLFNVGPDSLGLINGKGSLPDFSTTPELRTAMIEAAPRRVRAHLESEGKANVPRKPEAGPI